MHVIAGEYFSRIRFLAKSLLNLSSTICDAGRNHFDQFVKMIFDFSGWVSVPHMR